MDRKIFYDVVQVCKKYSHIGNIIYYESITDKPKIISNDYLASMRYYGTYLDDPFSFHSFTISTEYGLAYNVKLLDEAKTKNNTDNPKTLVKAL